MKGQNEIESRRREYFTNLPNFRDNRMDELSCLGRGEVWREKGRKVDVIIEAEVLKLIKKIKSLKCTWM